MRQFEVDSHVERLAEECLEASSRAEEGKAEEEGPQTARGQEAPPEGAALAKGERVETVRRHDISSRHGLVEGLAD